MFTFIMNIFLFRDFKWFNCCAKDGAETRELQSAQRLISEPNTAWCIVLGVGVGVGGGRFCCRTAWRVSRSVCVVWAGDSGVISRLRLSLRLLRSQILHLARCNVNVFCTVSPYCFPFFMD
jgi:hypothetical protein